MELKFNTEKKKSIKDDLEDIEENLNIKEEINDNKISTKALNLLFENHFNKETNLKNTFYTRSNLRPRTVKVQTIFPNQKSFTKRELRNTMIGILNKQKRASINNFRDNFSSSLNSKNRKILNHNMNLNQIKIHDKKIYIEYEDLYFEDDMFIPESSSFPNEHEEDFLLKLQFIEENNYDEDIVDYSIRNNSISYIINNSDDIYLRYFDNKLNDEKILDKKVNTFKKDNLFFDEKEAIGKNILYIERERNSLNTRRISKNNENDDNINENTISYISLDLLIKKIATEGFRNEYPDIYACIIQQFKYFIPIKNFITKIILAYKYYNNKSINLFELIIFLNEIILKNYELFKNDKELLEQIQILYLKLKNLKFDDQKYNEDFIKINYLLFKNSNKSNELFEKDNKKDNDNDNDIINEKNFTNRKSKAKSFFFKSKKKKDKSQDKYIKEIKEREKRNYNYFYIFNYNKEEIAAYLTLDSYQLISNIPENELFNKNFIKKDKQKTAPNIIKIIERFDKLILFIIEDISSYDNKADRVEIIEKWLRIGLVCMEFKNFNDLVMINSLFCNYLLKKMKLTWQKISKKSINYIEKMNKFCSGNQCYIKIRKEIFKCKGRPYVPYLGILLKEIMGVEEMKYIINNNINIEKLVKLNKIISHFFEFKKNKYQIEKPNQLDILSNINPKKEDEIELIIKQIEPKLTIHTKKGDKKRITRSDELFYKNNN